MTHLLPSTDTVCSQKHPQKCDDFEFVPTHCKMTTWSELHKPVTWNDNKTFFLLVPPAAKSRHKTRGRTSNGYVGCVFCAAEEVQFVTSHVPDAFLSTMVCDMKMTYLALHLQIHTIVTVIKTIARVTDTTTAIRTVQLVSITTRRNALVASFDSLFSWVVTVGPTVWCLLSFAVVALKAFRTLALV